MSDESQVYKIAKISDICFAADLRTYSHSPPVLI